MSSIALEVEPLIENLRDAVRLRDTEAITARIKEELEDLISGGGLLLPERFRRAHAGQLLPPAALPRPELGFTALVMTWGPGQRTALHDHAGIWCVEGVVEGEMEVTRYELLEEADGGLCRFDAARHRARRGPGRRERSSRRSSITCWPTSIPAASP